MDLRLEKGIFRLRISIHGANRNTPLKMTGFFHNF